MTTTIVDMHCHLCAGLDDGPQTSEQSLEMCKIAYRNGTSWIAATAHQGETWPKVSSAAILDSVKHLVEQLRQHNLPLCIRPTAEVMLSSETLGQWDAGELLSYDNQKAYLLVEFPWGVFFDIRELVMQFRERGVRLVLAHPERHPELLHGLPVLVELIRLGCLVQVSASSFERFRTKEDEKTLKTWARSGAIHLIGSDGHSPHRRPPVANQAYHRLVEWIGASRADRICTSNGLAILQGVAIRPPMPVVPKPRRYLSWLLPGTAR